MPEFQTPRKPEDVQMAIYNVMFAGIGDLRSLLNDIRSSGVHHYFRIASEKLDGIQSILATMERRGRPKRKTKKPATKRKAKRK